MFHFLYQLCWVLTFISGLIPFALWLLFAAPTVIRCMLQSKKDKSSGLRSTK